MKKIYRVMLFGLLTTQAAQCSITFFDATSYIVSTGSALFSNSGSVGQSQIATGSLWLGVPTNVTGSNLVFNQGNYTNGNFNVVMTAVYDPTSSPTIQMSGSAKLNFTTIGTLYEKIQVSGTHNVIEGLPFFGTPNALNVLSGGVLTMDLQGPLNQNIVLASGSVLSLGGNLELEDNILITGPGTVNFNDFNLILGKKDLSWTNTLTMLAASNLELNSTNSLYGRWYFQGDSNIVGNTNILDLTPDGRIDIGRGTTLRMTNLVLNGLGSGRIRVHDASSKLELYNVVINMDSSTTFTIGSVYAAGPVTVVTGTNFLYFTNQAVLTVDTTTVLYDT